VKHAGQNSYFAIKIALAAINLFFIAAWLYPVYWNWSVFQTEPFRTIGLILIPINLILIIFNSPAQKLGDFLAGLLTRLSNKMAGFPTVIKLSLWVIIPLVILYLIRTRTYAYGDGYNIIGGMVNRGLIAPIYNGVCVFWTAMAEIFGITTEPQSIKLLSAISIASGIILIYFACKCLNLLAANPKVHPITFLLAITSGFMVLFTGYIEAYSIVTAWLCIYLYYSLRVIKNQTRLRTAILIFIIGVFWHFWFIAFLPSLIMLINHKKQTLPNMIIAALTGLYVVGIYIGGLIIKRGEYELTIPMIANEATRYTVFSLDHLIDYLNVLIIVGPAIPIIALIAMISPKRAKMPAQFKFLAYASIPALAIGFLIDPMMGAMRDWDLLSFFALPLTLFGLAAVFFVCKQVRMVLAVLIPILILNIVHLGGFVITNYDRDNAIDNILRIARNDPHYSAEYHNGKRTIRFCSILNNIYHRNHEALELMERISDAPDVDYADKIGLARLYYNAQDYPNAVKYYEKVDTQQNPLTLHDRSLYGLSLTQCGQLYFAIQQYKIIAEDTAEMKIFYMIGRTYLAMQELDSSVKYFDKAITYSDDSIAFITGCRDLFYSYNFIPQTARYQRRLLDIFPDSAEIRNGLDILLKNQGNPDTSKQLR
jgi:tetratricopeptide (TPR) repeat protein